MRITTFFVLLCLYNTRADVRPSTLDDHEEALKVNTPLINSPANQRIKEGVLEQSKSDKTPHVADKNAEFIDLLKRKDKLEAEVNSLVDGFAGCTEGLLDEKILKRHEINELRNDIEIFRQSFVEGFDGKLKEAEDTCQATTNELLKMLDEHLPAVKERMKSSIKQEILKEYQNVLENLDEKVDNAVCRCTENELPEILEEKHDEQKPPQPFCPESWEQHGDMCYLYYEHDQLDWSSALQKCRDYGGTLIEIKGSETNDFIKKRLNPKRGFWVGGTKNDKGVWLWEESGDEILYPDWLFDKEQSHEYSTNCLAVLLTKRIADNCKFGRTYICQKELVLD